MFFSVFLPFFHFLLVERKNNDNLKNSTSNSNSTQITSKINLTRNFIPIMSLNRKSWKFHFFITEEKVSQFSFENEFKWNSCLFLKKLWSFSSTKKKLWIIFVSPRWWNFFTSFSHSIFIARIIFMGKFSILFEFYRVECKTFNRSQWKRWK